MLPTKAPITVVGSDGMPSLSAEEGCVAVCNSGIPGTARAFYLESFTRSSHTIIANLHVICWWAGCPF